MKTICVFCGSSARARAVYLKAAEEFARFLAGCDIEIVYGGGHVGLMGALADAALAAGGKVQGVIPQTLVERELAHRGVDKLHIVNSMHERKALMGRLSDGFVALPGAFGTFEEFFEVVTWTQLGIHHKPCGLLNVDGYFDSLLALCDRAVADGFMLPATRNIVIADSDQARLLERLVSAEPRAAR
ncbi:MAG: TIGR00730 family Rossman fold protein [Candidatus Eremiobacteraeota bacterium]|nr:TIGR00730 family Rossman fold protein [Candidatus Eremiobacteraeota bacterium]MBV8367196.1 TIGR00730 family Rossman fold protein [Candidatus Eremiobacteraeota bacterium]